MDEEIFTKIKTTESAELFKSELELLLKSLYLGSNEFNSVLKTQVRATLSEYLRDKFSEGNTNFEEFLKDLIKKIQKIPPVRLIVAYEPSANDIDRFYSFVTRACQQKIFLDLGYSPEIIGGAIIIYKGNYRDFSFKKIFEKEFESDQENILKLLEK